MSLIFSAIDLPSQGQTGEWLENLGPNVNSPFDEQNPMLSPDGKVLFFTRSKHPENVGGVTDLADIWYCTMTDDGSWSPAQNLGRPLNDRFPNAIIGFSPDGRLMYLRNYYINDHRNPVQQGISVSKGSTDGWSYPENLTIQYFMNKSDHQSTSLSADGKTMVMAIESYGTYGAEDIYVSFIEKDGSWSEPKNLGATINTSYHEMTPYLAEDNQTLYFASNGHKGFGSRDIFSSTRLDDTWRNWTEPQNLGPEVNTPGLELSYLAPPLGAYDYVTSTQNSDGYGDINRVNKKEVKVPDSVVVPEIPLQVVEIVELPFTGTVLSKVDQTPLDAKVLYRIDDGTETSLMMSAKAISGRFAVTLEPGKNYLVEVTAPGYLTQSEEFRADEPIHRNFALAPIEIGVSIRLQHVLFETGTTQLTNASFKELDMVVTLMKENPEMEIELSGHTDNQGNSKLNLQLSDDRVQVVKKYLVEKGIKNSRITGRGYGGTRPIASNANEESRKLNRRVEFTILKN